MDTMQETTVILNTNLRRASELVKSFKQMAVNQSIEEKSHFSLYDLIQMLLTSLKHEFKNTDIQFQIDCSPELELYNYSGAFTQILTNLIMNSLIHGFKENKSGTIKISAIVTNSELNLIYSDNGLGISPHNLQRIFEPFFTTN